MNNSAPKNGLHFAFPVFDASGNVAVYAGLTKREYMATAILTGLCSLWAETREDLAGQAVKQADALLAELAK